MTENILIIDDEKALRLLYSQELERSGYRVKTAANASEAEAIISKEDFALAVVDIEMPGTDGLALLGKLREMAPGMALVINSAYSTYKADFNSWLANGYIVKSSDLGPLKDKIKDLLVKSGTGK
jgi:DNA-binding NtrC family response regulator